MSRPITRTDMPVTDIPPGAHVRIRTAILTCSEGTLRTCEVTEDSTQVVLDYAGARYVSACLPANVTATEFYDRELSAEWYVIHDTPSPEVNTSGVLLALDSKGRPNASFTQSSYLLAVDDSGRPTASFQLAD